VRGLLIDQRAKFGYDFGKRLAVGSFGKSHARDRECPDSIGAELVEMGDLHERSHTNGALDLKGDARPGEIMDSVEGALPRFDGKWVPQARCDAAVYQEFTEKADLVLSGQALTAHPQACLPGFKTPRYGGERRRRGRRVARNLNEVAGKDLENVAQAVVFEGNGKTKKTFLVPTLIRKADTVGVTSEKPARGVPDIRLKKNSGTFIGLADGGEDADGSRNRQQNGAPFGSS
jgi:hypothetical protein